MFVAALGHQRRGFAAAILGCGRWVHLSSCLRQVGASRRDNKCCNFRISDFNC